MNKEYQKAVEVLKGGGIVVMPSDTVYGIFASAYDQDVVERLYEVRKRETGKPCIVLISDISELDSFGVDLSSEMGEILEVMWSDDTQLSGREKTLRNALDKPKMSLSSASISAVLLCDYVRFDYLKRGGTSLSFRVPSGTTERGKKLKELLRETGPLIAPSANLPGEKPAENISDAKNYFGDGVDLYIGDDKKIIAEPSHIFSFVEKKFVQLR